MIKFNSLFLSLIIATFAFSQVNNAAADASDLMKDAISQGEMAGVSAGVHINGELVWSASEGYANVDEKTAFTTTTITRIASISKPMTAVAIMQLKESGKIALDDKVSKYIDVFSKEELKDITIKHLLGHSSGIQGYKDNKEANNLLGYATLEDALAIFIERDLAFAPGTDFSYTTYGYVVLGLLIEVVSGQSYEQYMKENIWDPIGMINTSVEEFDREYANKSLLYHKSKGTGPVLEDPTNLSDRVPGGGIQSSVEDVLRFGSALLDGSLISANSLQEMTTNTGLKKDGNSYGLGWYLYKSNTPHGAVFGHNGAQIGCSAFLFLLPDQNKVTVVLSNTSGANTTVSTAAVTLFGIGN